MKAKILETESLYQHADITKSYQSTLRITLRAYLTSLYEIKINFDSNGDLRKSF